MTVPVLHVDLARPPETRWEGLAAYKAEMRELIATYVHDLGGLDLFRDALELYRDTIIPREQLDEMEAIAKLAALDPLEVLLANAYYDVFKHVMGCTAFAVETPDGPLHARNLDWWTERDALSRHTIIVRYHRAGEPIFDAVTWPGFIGTLSGVAHGRFSVTLNAVLSDGTPGIALPIGLLLRELLTSATYASAKARLESIPITCDCLLLLVGARPGEMCVIERTPSQSAVRMPEGGAIVVTNDYRLLSAPGWESADRSLLQATSCGRFDRALARARKERPTTPEDCFAILDDEGVRMKITVQQMVMAAARGLTSVRRPS